MEYNLNFRKIAFQGKRCAIYVDNVSMTGKPPMNFEVCGVKDCVAIVIVNTVNNKIVLNENFRYPVGESILELVAGLIEKDEIAMDAAIREIKEETGFAVKRIISLGKMYTSPGLSTEKCHLFLAYGHPDGEKNLEDMEDLVNKEFTMSEVSDMLREGRFKDLKTAYGLHMFLSRTGLPSCPSCGIRAVETVLTNYKFTYGVGSSAVELSADIPLRVCSLCKFSYRDYEAEEVMDKVAEDYVKTAGNWATPNSEEDIILKERRERDREHG